MKMKKNNFLRLSAAVALALGASSTATFAANDTTASLKGLVNVDDAKVSIEYEPTGLTKTRDLGDGNNFSFSFLPIGGPYTISVTAEGYEPVKLENIYLALYEKNNMNFELKKVGANDERIVVYGKKGSGAGQNFGTGSTLYREEMDGIPTVNRSIADLARMDPRININAASTNIEISAMGVNNRFNDFQIDGVSFNDPFGLNASGFAGARNPISMDFVDQIAVDLTPYDVSRSGATGATISVVTKSGTNEFDGSVYYSTRDEGDFGDLPNGDTFPPFSETTKNFTLSGPIIEDKLFFFVGYEEFELSSPFTFGPAGSGALNESNAPAADFERLAQIANDVYGFDPGGYEGLSFPETSEEYVVKLDYMINDDHRIELNYSNKEEESWRNYGLNRFESEAYVKPPVTKRTSVNYFGDLTENLNVNATFTSYKFTEDAESIGGLFPDVTVTTASGDRISLGGERYRGANFIDVQYDTYAFKANYSMGEHVFTAGFEYEEGTVINQFLARYNGEIRFDSIDDFETGDWSYLRFQVPTAGLNDLDSISANFDVEQLSFYIQDAWTVSDKLSIQYGVRVDSLETPTAPVENAAFVAEYGYTNAQKFDYSVAQPRASFEYDLTEAFAGDVIENMTLRGGYGLFMGRFPNVWLGNAYSRPGPLSDYPRFYGTDATIGQMPAGDPRFFWLNSPNSTYTIAAPGSSSASQYVGAGFEAPSTWRGNLGLDLTFTDGTEVTLEYNRDDVNKSLAITDPGLVQTGTLADGRGVYDTSGSLELTNTGLGGAESFTMSVRRNFFDNLNLYAAYTNTDSRDAWNMTSSQAESGYGYQQRFDGENIPETRSAYMVEHRFVMSLDYTEQFWGDNDTRVSLVFSRQSGEPYSVVYDNGYNSLGGSGYGGSDLAYIPTGAGDANVVFADAQTAADVMAFIDGSGLASYKGTYAPRNALTSPWTSRADIRITQEIQFPEYWDMIGENRAVITLDIMNIGGRMVQEYSNNNSAAIITNGVDGTGRINITGLDSDDGLYTRASGGESSWGVRLGFKYEF